MNPPPAMGTPAALQGCKWEVYKPSYPCWSHKGTAGISARGRGRIFVYIICMHIITNIQFYAEKRTGGGVRGTLNIKFIKLEQCEQSNKSSPTGMMRALISVWYIRKQLTACSATSGINQTAKTAIFSKYIT